MLKNFKIAQLEFKISPQSTLLLPEYKGSTFRGGFGHAFKKVVCVIRNKICSDCLLKEKCVYSYVFETPPPKDTKMMRKYPAVPHPFIIEPPLEEKREYEKGEEITFGLTLIGKAIDYLPYFIYALDELGRIGLGKGKSNYELKEVKTLSKNGGDGVKRIYSGEDKTLVNLSPTLTFKEIEKNGEKFQGEENIELEFLTPTRLKYQEKLVSNLEFHILLRNLLRRISTLSYFHCDEELNLDYKELIDRAKNIKVKTADLKWKDWQRYSSRQDTKMSLGGFKGKITFEGDIKNYLPFLLLGEYIHIGKGTSFGLGKYEIK